MSNTLKHRSTPARPHLGVHILLILGAVVMFSPFIWEMLTSIRSYQDSIAVPPKLFAPIVLDNYAAVFTSTPFGPQLMNSVVMTLLRTLGQVLFCTAAGFAFARLRFPGRNVIFAVLLSALMLPTELLLLSQFQIIQSLGLVNSMAALVLPSVVSAFGVFLMRQFFMQLPEDVLEAARIDGANAFQIFFRIAMPLATNGMLALGILTAIWSWNDLLWPLIVNSDQDKMPLSVGLASLSGQYITNYPVLMAGSLLASIPMLILFIAFQRSMIAGIAAGAVKG